MIILEPYMLYLILASVFTSSALTWCVILEKLSGLGVVLQPKGHQMGACTRQVQKATYQCFPPSHPLPLEINK